MTTALPYVSSVKSVVPNPAWATLPLFDRTGWKRVRFGDVVENCNETCDPAETGLERFVAMEHLEPGSLHMRSWGNVADGTTFTRRCGPGQVLFGKRRAYQRKVAVAEFEAVVSGDIYVLAPKDTRRLLPELLPFLCLSERFFQHAVGTSAGSLSPRTNWSSLASFEFDLPPLDQQRRIAKILWAVDEAKVRFEKAVQQVVSNIEELRKALPGQMQKCLAFFPNVDRTVGGYEGLLAAQQHLPNNAVRDKFAGEYTVLGTIWEALSPDPCLGAYAKDYKWLTQVYESVKPVSGNGRMLWHRLGAKTIELINENVHVEAVRDDVEALVLDADVLESILKDSNPAKKAKEVEIKLIARLRKHAGNPKFTELGERLEKIREKHEQGLLNSMEFLKAILEVAKDTVEAEKQVAPEGEKDKALSALTELFNEVKSKHTHVIVERIVADIDAIVKQVRFPIGKPAAKANARCGRRYAAPCSNINSTRIRSFSTRPTGISESIIKVQSLRRFSRRLFTERNSRGDFANGQLGSSDVN